MTCRQLFPPRFALTLVLAVACSDDDSEPTITSAPVTASAGPTGGASNPTGASSDPGTESETGETGETTGGVASEATAATIEPTGEPTTATSAAETTEAATTGTSEPAPTEGPGVLPGEDGMDAFCRRYKECGGTYYDSEQACLDATYDYWGDCPSRKAALDAFGACMSEMACSDWNPDGYVPADTPCGAEWDEVGASEPCG